MSRIAVQISHMRAGSHMLGTAINSHPDIQYTGDFIQEVVDREGTLEQVLKDMYNNEPKVILADIKYNTYNSRTSPLFEGNSVIHIYREDTKRAYYSHAFGLQRLNQKIGEHDPKIERNEQFMKKTTQRKVNDKTYQTPPNPISFDWSKYKGFREHILRGREKFDPMADFSISYEKLTGNKEIQEIPEEYARKICEVLGVDYYPLKTPMVKKSPINPFKNASG